MGRYETERELYTSGSRYQPVQVYDENKITVNLTLFFFLFSLGRPFVCLSPLV
jgi:hypothetical protein